MKKILIFICIFTVISGIFCQNAFALENELPYQTYVYDLQNKPVTVKAAFKPAKAYGADNIGCLPFSQLTDIFYDGNGKIYLTDTGSNTIIITDKDFNLIHTLTGVEIDGKFSALSSPGSVYADKDFIYIADTKNARILKLDANTYGLIKIYGKPKANLLEENYNYEPQKIAVDYAKRIYVIANGINYGLMQIEESGDFAGFLGAPKVVPKLTDIFWRKISTDAQLKQMTKFVPTEYSSIYIDDDGFLYCTSGSTSVDPICRLNSQGENVLKATSSLSNGQTVKPAGDTAYKDNTNKGKKSSFVDVQSQPDGSYYALDANSGRIFFYDYSGMLLYVFGGLGSQIGTFYSPGSITIVDGSILVTDQTKNTVTVFEKTSFAKSIDKANALHQSGDYEESATVWKDILNQCSSYYIADIQIARLNIQNGDYSGLDRLKQLGERTYYAKAFENYRNNFIRNNFALIIGVIIAVIVAVTLISKLTKKPVIQKVANTRLVKELRYSNYVIFHPFDGFWDLKHEKKGSALSATVLLAAFAVLFALRSQFTGYIVSPPKNGESVIFSVAKIILPIMLWVISNWCFTTLMDGEGKLKNIYIATCYALKPYIIIGIPLLLASQVITVQELTFYNLFDKIAIVWMLALFYFGSMMTHNYSFKQTFVSTLLSVIGICIMIFICLLFFNILQDIFNYFLSLYKELDFRFN